MEMTETENEEIEAGVEIEIEEVKGVVEREPAKVVEVEEKVAKIPAKEIGLKFGYDIDDENKTLDDLIQFTEKVS